MFSHASKCDIGGIAKAVIGYFAFSFVRESRDSSLAAIVQIVVLSIGDGVRQWSTCSAEINGRRDQVDVLVQHFWQRVGLGSDNVALTIGVDAILGIKHLFSYRDGYPNVDPVGIDLSVS